MPIKRRIVKTKHAEISEVQWATLLDRPLPADTDEWEEYLLAFPTVTEEKSRALWNSARDAVLGEFIKEKPGQRPTWWFLFDPDCPRVEAADIQRYKWQGYSSLSHIPALRRRLGGVGTPTFEVLNLAPSFQKGIPDDWITVETLSDTDEGLPVDTEDPPVYESEIEYLERHGLLRPGEKERARKVNPRAFDRIVVTVQ